jgi:phage tail sheath protein FI
MRVTNRFEQKWRPVIDAGMDLTLRNDILTEEQDFLYYLVSVRALIGSPRCEFSPIDNTKESISQGHFYFKDFITYTPPAKYIDLGVSFTDEGYTVYLED